MFGWWQCLMVGTLGMTVIDQHPTCLIFRVIVSLWVWSVLCMVYIVVLCCAQMHRFLEKKKTFHISQNTDYTSLYYCHGYNKFGRKKRVCSTDLLKWAKIPKIELPFVFLLHLVTRKLWLALISQNTEQLRSSNTQHRPCPPNAPLVKVKDPWRSAPQLVRGPQATWAASVEVSPSFFLLLRSFCQRLTGVKWRWSMSLMSWAKLVYTAHTWDLMNTFFNQTFIYSSCIC